MKTNSKPDFLSEVTDEMDKGGDDAYGADMGDDETDEGSSDEEKQDRILAIKSFGKAIGVTIEDPERAAEALSTFIEACSKGTAKPAMPADEAE